MSESGRSVCPEKGRHPLVTLVPSVAKAGELRPRIQGVPLNTSQLALLVEARKAVRSGQAARTRRAAGLSQAELAQAVGVSAPAISRWESGKRQPHGRAAIRYAQVLRMLDAGRVA
jgi:DNA-binding XRE family transcriptional regulator